MKITFLGTGSAYGIPTCGGDWGVCDPANPKNKRLCQSILLETGGAKILIDMGPSFREQSNLFNLKDLDAILFTHSHYDHFAGLPELPNFVKYQTRPLSLYAHPDTWSGIKRSIFWMFDDKINVQYYGDHRPEIKEFAYYEPLTIGDVQILPFLQNHGGMKSSGFRIGNVAYTTDLNSLPEQSWAVMDSVETWILECDAVAPSTDHNDLAQAIDWVSKVKPKKAYLTHLAITMDHASVSKKLPANMQVAWDGLQITAE